MKQLQGRGVNNLNGAEGNHCHLPDTWGRRGEQVEKQDMSGCNNSHSDKDSGGLDHTMVKQIVCPQMEETKSKSFDEC